MGLLSRFTAQKRFLSRKSTIEQTNPKNPFDKDGKRNRAELQRFINIYRTGGLITQAINAYNLAILSNGYRVECEDEGTKKSVEEFLNRIYFEEVISQDIIAALCAGDSFSEISYGRGGEAGTILEVLPRNPASFDVLYDKYGSIQGYRHYMPGSTSFNEEFVDLAPTEIIHTNFNTVGGVPYGIGLIGPAIDDIERDCKIAESIEQAIIRHGFPKYKITVGKEGETVPKEVMTALEAQFRDVNAKNEWLLSSDMDMQMIDNSPLGDIKSYGDWSIDRLTAALAVPAEILGLGRGSTEATAKVRMQFFYGNVGSMQKRLANSYNRQLIDRFTQRPGFAKICFEEVNPEDATAVVDRVVKLISANPMDPESIIDANEAREMLGMEPREDVELEEYV